MTRLTLIFRGKPWVATDASRSANALVRGSLALPPDGVGAHVLTEGQFLAGEDAVGALVVLGPETKPIKEVRTAICERGGLGFISDFSIDRYAAPDAVPSIFSASEDGIDLPLVGYAVTPRIGDRIRTLAASGNLEAKAESRGREGIGKKEEVRSAGESDAAGTSRPQSIQQSNNPTIKQSSIVAALRAVGVAQGDFLLVHSSLKAIGWIDGGPGAVIAALREAVGPAGTVLFPAFTCSFRTLGVVCKTWSFRPYDPNDLKAMKWVGSLAPELLRTTPDAPRSRHVTNGWTGFGPGAAAALAEHRPDDPPFGERSPLAKALAAKGKVLFLGADVKSCTFLHHLEDRFDLPGLGPILASVKGEDGHPYDVAVPRHVPGPREFYEKGEEARFFREAKARGLEIRRAPLGEGLVKAIELEPLDRIGSALCREDPRILFNV